MSKKRIYYPPTTSSQRKTVFEVWEETGDVDEACRKARVSKSTFYYWKPRFETGGYEALEQVQKPGQAPGIQVKPEKQKKVIEMKKEHPKWGKKRIADELAKQNNWEALISPNTVRRVLVEAGLWVKPEPEAKKKR